MQDYKGVMSLPSNIDVTEVLKRLQNLQNLIQAANTQTTIIMYDIVRAQEAAKLQPVDVTVHNQPESAAPAGSA